ALSRAPHGTHGGTGVRAAGDSHGVAGRERTLPIRSPRRVLARPQRRFTSLGPLGPRSARAMVGPLAKMESRTLAAAFGCDHARGNARPLSVGRKIIGACRFGADPQRHFGVHPDFPSLLALLPL